ncbi:hypothetical protein [uncultured Desulfobacter sp.]|uniref:hypothetical protein n=1 Tax=uncultured Desulfobacter sp. TaxID=240139 RepID=UPI00259B52BD|nr:hypothetical protein [uncultured Desulfobacter sp.]
MTLSESIASINAKNYLLSSPDSHLLLKAFRGSEWQVLRLLIFGTNKTQPFVNRTKYDKSGQPRFQGVVPVIPNIFNFNEYGFLTPEAGKDKTALGFKNKILVKVRILQYLSNNGTNVGIINLFQWLTSTFDQEWGNELRYETRELIFSNLLKCHDERIDQVDIDDPNAIKRNYGLSTTTKTDVIEKLLDSSIYYEIVVDNTPIDSRYIHLFNPLHRIECESTWDYLKIKIKYIIYFLLYLEQVEEEEKKRSQLESNVYSPYVIFSNDRESKIKDDIYRFLNGYLERKNENYATLQLSSWRSEIVRSD